MPGAESDDEDLHFMHEFLELSWQKDGLDYDRYLREFESGPIGVFKSLVKLSKERRDSWRITWWDSVTNVQCNCR